MHRLNLTEVHVKYMRPKCYHIEIRSYNVKKACSRENTMNHMTHDDLIEKRKFENTNTHLDASLLFSIRVQYMSVTFIY